MPAQAVAAAAAQTPGNQQSQTDQDNRSIIVTAPPIFHDIRAERDLDEEAIESYGVSTIDELLGELQVELGEEAEQPLIIVNGQRVNDLDEIGALPVEVLKNLQVLPRGSALRAGGTSTQRVINITLKRKVRSATVTGAHKIATEGNWNSDRGEAILTNVRGNTRANLTFRVRDDDSLLESDRGIIQPAPVRPYALGGNIIGYPNTLGEIDPALSTLAGEPVTLVPVPTTIPTLADLVAVANHENTTDIGHFRTLRPQSRNYDLNGTFATRLSPWLTTSATLRWGHSVSNSLRGLPNALFTLSPTNPASPFSRQVALAYYGKTPLHSQNRHNGGEANVTFDANWGRWQGNLNVHHTVSNDVSLLERQASFGAIPIADTVNPFTTDLTSLITLANARTSARSVTTLADLTLNGPAVTLPAGDLQTIVEARLGLNRLTSQSTFSSFGNGTFRRNEQSLRGALEIPLTSRENKFFGAVGDLSASLEYGRTHYSDAGSVNHYTYGFTWEPRPILRLHGSIDETDLPAPIQTIGNPVILYPDVRVFDPLTGQTVDVTEITGGNASLLPQKTKIHSLSALLRLVPKLNLQLNGEYTDTDLRNFVSSLPEASAAVMLAFPDRFIRNSEGVLTTIDLRPVNFESHREKRLRWGFSMNTKVGGGVPPGTAGAPHGPSKPSTYLQLTANHTMVFSDEIRIRPGLDPVNLLEGGAIGIGGGRARHQIDGTAAITSGGLGVRAGVTWRGPNTLQSRFGSTTDTLQFSSLLTVNVRAFADAGRVIPHAHWAKGFRISLDALNVTNSRQRVRDSLGSTPLQYQPAYRDPIGRTIEIEIRKVF